VLADLYPVAGLGRSDRIGPAQPQTNPRRHSITGPMTERSVFADPGNITRSRTRAAGSSCATRLLSIW
jgi:hypothetical protein